MTTGVDDRSILRAMKSRAQRTGGYESFIEHVLQKCGRDAAVVHTRSSAVDDSICIEGLTATMRTKGYVGACRRGIDGLQMTFVDLQGAVPKLGFDDVGNRRRHTMA